MSRQYEPHNRIYDQQRCNYFPRAEKNQFQNINQTQIKRWKEKVFPREQAQQICAALYELIIKTASLDSSSKSWDDIVKFLSEAGVPVSKEMDKEMREVENSLRALGLE